MRLVKRNAAKFALASALALGMTGAALAQNVVVRATGPSAGSYPAGKKLSDSARVALQSGDSVTVLGRSGTRVFKGPGTFSLASRSGVKSTSRTRLASYIGNTGSRVPRGGAVRGAGPVEAAKPTKPSIWFLDVNASGNFCVIGDSAVLWRPDFTGSSSLDIVNPESGKITKVMWTEDKPRKAWPSEDAPISDGATYRLNASGMGAEKAITFKMLSEAPIDEVSLTETLVANGCDTQVDELLALYGVTTEADGETSADQG